MSLLPDSSHIVDTELPRRACRSLDNLALARALGLALAPGFGSALALKLALALALAFRRALEQVIVDGIVVDIVPVHVHP